MPFFTLVSSTLLLVFSLNSHIAQAVTQADDKAELFDPSQEPTAIDWQRFNRFEPKKRQSLWTYFSKQGKTLKHWSWGWRIGWIRTCANDKHAFCPKLINDALNDNALVVRAEAASMIGRIYEGTKNKAAIAQLEKAYRDDRNNRNGKPLFVQNRILEALKNIGGEDAQSVGTRLASTDPTSKLYWQKLNRL